MTLMTSPRSRSSATVDVFRTGALLLLALGMVLLRPIPVAAHVALVGATPLPNSTVGQPPKRIRLRFDEPPDPQFSQITLLDTSGRTVAGGPAQSAADANTIEVAIGALQPALYTVAWQALAPDGHLTKGNYAFTLAVTPGSAAPTDPQPIGASANGAQTAPQPTASSDTPSVVAVFVHWWRYVALGLLVGTPGVGTFVVRPATRAIAGGAAQWRRAVRMLHHWMVGSLLAFAVAHAATLVIQAAAVINVSPLQVRGDTIHLLLFDTVYGGIWRLTAVATVALPFLLVLGTLPFERANRASTTVGFVASARPAVRTVARPPDAIPAMWPWTLGLVAAFFLVGTLSLSSHAIESQHQPLLALIADGVHLGAMGLWLGGLLVLLAILPGWLRPLSARARTAMLTATIERFSSLGLAGVTALVVTGVYAMMLHTTRPTILNTSYGQTLLIKHALVLPLIGVAALNLLVIKPRLRKRWARRWLRHLMAIEAVLGIMILLVTSLLTQLPPAHPLIGSNASAANLRLTAAPLPINSALGTTADISSGPQSSEMAHSDQVVAVLAATTGRDGSSLSANIIDPATVTGHGITPAGQATPVPAGTEPRQLADVERVTALITFGGADLGQTEVPLANEEDGWYRARGVFFPIKGEWHIQLVVRRHNIAEDARLDFSFISDPARFSATAPAAATGAAPAPRFLWPRLLPTASLGFAIALIGLGLFALTTLAGRHRAVGPRSLRFLRLWCAAVITVGIVVVGYNSSDRTVTSGLTNPLPNDAATLALGQQTYAQNCAVCHGASGRGDGPLAQQLQPRPADFASGHLATHTDGDIYQWVTHGIPGTGMPAFTGTLSEQETWAVIRYIRTLRGSA